MQKLLETGSSGSRIVKTEEQKEENRNKKNEQSYDY